MDNIEDLLKLPLGRCLAEGNWESHVHELGNNWVYKEIKQPNSIAQTVDEYKSRQLLQKFWSSETHFKNMINDYEIFKSEIGAFIPKTLLKRSKSLIDESTIVNISVQEKLNGTLLKDIEGNFLEVTELAKSIKNLCEKVFNAPPDFHPGNLLLTDEGQLFFFDTGTPSDWIYFLDPDKMSGVIKVTLDEATLLTEFMKPIHVNHWQKLREALGTSVSC